MNASPGVYLGGVTAGQAAKAARGPMARPSIEVQPGTTTQPAGLTPKRGPAQQPLKITERLGPGSRTQPLDGVRLPGVQRRLRKSTSTG